MEKVKVVFLCGDKSPYGLAHLEPILNEFKVVAVVISDNNRWKIFRESLSGKTYNYQKGIFLFFNKILKRMISLIIKSQKKNKSVSKILSERNIPTLVIHDVNSIDSIHKIQSFEPDLLISAAYPQIFCEKLIEVAKKGTINFHPSLLPKFRGAHPHFWAIAKGEKIGGITAHFMTENIDNGDIIAQLTFPIDNYYYSEYYNRIVTETPQLVKKVAKFFNEGVNSVMKQDETKATYFRNDRDIHRRLFWNSMTAIDIHNLIRTEQSYCFYKDDKINVLKADIVYANRNLTNDIKVEPGIIVDINDKGLVVSTIGEELVLITEFGSAWGKQSFKKWIHKHSINIGERLQ